MGQRDFYFSLIVELYAKQRASFSPRYQAIFEVTGLLSSLLLGYVRGKGTFVFPSSSYTWGNGLYFLLIPWSCVR